MILAGDFIPKASRVRLPKEFAGQLVLANLEGPVCEDGLPKAAKTGPCLHTSASALEVEVEGGLGRFAFSLANNHLMDFQEEGRRQTVRNLQSRQIPFAGAGQDKAEAQRPIVLEENGRGIAVFCCCERQFGVATASSPGVAEKGLWLLSAIRSAKLEGFDHVIVSCHCASEFSPFVSPELRTFYYALIDAGADVIHGHHAHVPQGYEVYAGKPIFYGLGNFVVDPEMWKGNSNQLWSLAVDMTFGDELAWTVKPYSICRRDGCLVVEPASDDGKLSYLETVNRQFESVLLLQGLWQEAACRLYASVYEQSLRAASVYGHSLSWRERVRKLFFAAGDCARALAGREFVTQKSSFYSRVCYNFFNCESHVDMIRTALGVLTGSLADFRDALSKSLADKVLQR